MLEDRDLDGFGGIVVTLPHFKPLSRGSFLKTTCQKYSGFGCEVYLNHIHVYRTISTCRRREPKNIPKKY